MLYYTENAEIGAFLLLDDYFKEYMPKTYELSDKKVITLEPMTANERRIIHSALQNNPRIKTFSVGEEPNRRMVISLSKTDAE